jgi:fatty acid synthase, bacteria type
MKTKVNSSIRSGLDNICAHAQAWTTQDELETIRTAVEQITHESLRIDGVQVLFDAFEETVAPRTKTLLRGVLYSDETSPIRHLINAGDVQVGLTFAGQAQDYIQDLERLYQIPESRLVIEAGCAALLDEYNESANLVGLHPLGVNAISWIVDPSTRPNNDYLASSAVSQPLIFLTQMAQFAALSRIGLESDRIKEWCKATTGHSQGIMAAVVASEGLKAKALAKRSATITRYMLWQGIEMQVAFGPALAEGHAMAAISGLDLEVVESHLEGTNVCVSLHNAFRRLVISGHPEEIEFVLTKIDGLYQHANKAFEDGKSSRPAQPLIERLSVSAPFHSSLVAGCMPALRDRMKQLDLSFTSKESIIPVIRYETGKVWHGECLIESQTVNRVNWPTALNGMRAHDVTHILDAGPGAGVSAISALEVRGYGIGVIPVATLKGEATLLSADRINQTAQRAWALYAPVMVTRGDGVQTLENRFTKETGYPPIFVPGMTPTTVETPIIAESANAGFLAELAGGGQTSETIFRKRAEELQDRLLPGTGYLVNTLYLDPYLWQLQIGRHRMVQKLRAEGHPILGVTITAGLPPKEEALELLTEFEELGMRLNSLKVGSGSQIEQALEIADEYEGSIILQVEGGAAGGHHSFDHLEELLLEWYPRIRRRKNCLLTVGGGIANGNRVSEFLTGTWSESYGVPPMPVDAVYLGTALMACKEAATSQAVKNALVKTGGTPKFVGRGETVGGVRSGRSGLGADIHYVDNHAAKTSAFLDTVAGNAELVAENRSKIIKMLAKTAKPYFGDLEGVSYADLLNRFVELMALGRGSRYEDGVWLDVTHRQRFHTMLNRALTRCTQLSSLPQLVDLDSPRKLLTQLFDEHPELSSRELLLEDQKFFINNVCSSPGKPVPFVPKVDENVRRWYCSDALWQSHDDRFDADAVLIIPGPNAVVGIDAANQPIAELLNDFLAPTYVAPITKRIDKMPSLKDVALRTDRLVTPFGVKVNPLNILNTLNLPHVNLVETETGVRLKLRHALPLRGHRDLLIDFEVQPFSAEPLRVSENMMSAIRDFYKRVMPQELTIDPDRIAAYRRITSDRGPSTPEQFYFAVTLPKIMQALLDEGLGLNPASLLHLSSEIQRRSGKVTGPLTCLINQISASDSPIGRTVVVDCDVVVRKTVVAQCQQTFLVREATGVIADTFRAVPYELPATQQHIYATARSLFQSEITAPSDLNAFSHISGDLNPIHRDQGIAVIAGLETPIVHGQWTAATACALLAGEKRRLVNSRSEFLGPVLPGELLSFKGEVVGLSEGNELCVVTVSNSSGPVLRVNATRECVRTALIFPGQGSQKRGMGMEQYKESAAARQVWDRADTHTKETYGFSILEVVQENPKFMRVGSSTVEHPEGVLNVTQFTQVALTVLSVAGVASLRERGIFPTHSWFCGHSVGEYSALAAVIDLFSLENLVDAVYHRGITMQEYIDRDEAGRSDYLMGVIRPHRIGMSGPQAIELIEEVHVNSGYPIYVVNHNIAGRQYAVAGHVKAIAALQEKLSAIDPNGEGWVNIPGIDVPFHSPLLKDGVPAFRTVLEGCIPTTVDIDRLVHRYVPNLVARPFELTDTFLDEMIEVTGHQAIEMLRPDLKNNGRAVLIELLAWQFASPVRWIETQAYLNESVERTIEVGPKGSPVLSNMFASGYRGQSLRIECLHAQRDALEVLGAGVEEAVETEEASSVTQIAAPVAAIATPVATAPVGGGPLDDESWSIESALFALLALRLNKPIGDLSRRDTIDELLGGNSARRNQILLDLGKEFGVGAIDGAHELPLEELGLQLKSAVGVRYTHPGGCLKTAQNEALNAISSTRKDFGADLNRSWGIGPLRMESVLTMLAINPNAQAEANPADVAAQLYAKFEGITLSAPSSQTGGQTTVDSGAVDALKEDAKNHWKSMARAALRAADLDPSLVDRIEEKATRTVTKSESQQSFDARRHIAFTQSHQWVKSDATAWFFKRLQGDSSASTDWVRAASGDTISLLEKLSETHSVERKQRTVIKQVCKAIEKSLSQPLQYTQEVAIVTGAGPDSIAESIVNQLLQGGATVIVSCSRLTDARRQHYKHLYRAHAGRGASLHLVPLNQGNLDDVAQFVEWVYKAEFEIKGADRLLIKRPWTPTLFFPFGAMPAEGDPTTIDDHIIRSLQVNLIGVESLVGQLAINHKQAGIKTPICTVLPLSPNHGQMGRDGLYAEAKIGLEALMQRRAAEFDRWGREVMLVGARIGWVRGTGLMAALDKVYEKVELDLGIKTFSTVEMATLILGQLPSGERVSTDAAPSVHDFTGGFSEAEGLRETINRALELAAQNRTYDSDEAASSLPYYDYKFPEVTEQTVKSSKRIDVDDAVCIVGFGEIGPFGNARIRWDYEKNNKVLSSEASLELAVWCGCIEFKNMEWVDTATGEAVDVNQLEETYGLNQRVGLRLNELFDPSKVVSFTEVVLSEDTSFSVPDRATAEAYLNAEPAHTEIFPTEDGYTVLRKKGAKIRVPKLDPIDRNVAGQVPTGYDPLRLGVDAQSIDQIDPVAIYNLLATSDAFRSAGLTPEELWANVHPARIASTQGSGIGGMRAQRRLYTESQLGENKQSDVLQETLINVTAAYAGMMYHGGYGAMINPVAACATAAISVEIAVDLLGQDKADFVVAGAFDDFSQEGARGFAEMQATIDTKTCETKGIEPNRASRPCDSRRGGFVEAQGGGTVLMCRLKTAVRMGLPVYGVVAGAWSGSDGIQRSVPAPGPGILRIGAGCDESPLAQSLSKIGLKPNDITAVSIHGTSTLANDKNETRLHSNLAKAIGRDTDLPLMVIAQKAITGHAKGGAAAWQMNGLLQAMRDNIVPGMWNLDEPDPALASTAPLVFSDQTIKVPAGQIKAGLITSLGFGHVAGAVCIAHPDSVLKNLSARDRKSYLQKRAQREQLHRSWSESVLVGDTPHFEARTERPFTSAEEEALLLSPAGSEMV